jgi:hypothetical protein
MKTYWGSGSIAPRILDLGAGWRWVLNFTPQPFYPQGKSPWYPLDRRLAGPQRRSGRGGEEKNVQPLLGLEPPIIQPVAQRCTTELFRLLHIQKLTNQNSVPSWANIIEKHQVGPPAKQFATIPKVVQDSKKTTCRLTHRGLYPWHRL